MIATVKKHAYHQVSTDQMYYEQEEEVTIEIIPLLASQRASRKKHDHRGSLLKPRLRL